jgi:hypothetical protein
VIRPSSYELAFKSIFDGLRSATSLGKNLGRNCMLPKMEEIDLLSFTTVRLQSFHNETLLSNATGFFYFGLLDNKPNFWFVTNWHVLSGRNIDPPHAVLHSKGGIPNRIRLNLILRSDQPEYASAAPDYFLFQELFIDLYESNGAAIWFQHPQKSDFDVGVINFSVLVDRCELKGINQVALQNDMAIEIGNQVFVLGYPLGFQHFMETPIWKRGVIASEPHLETPQSRNRVVIDAATRQGMSGAPVIMREKTHYLSEKRKIVRHANATRFIGIYASRPNIQTVADISDEDRRAEIGFFYKSGCVHETIVSGIRGPSFCELP